MFDYFAKVIRVIDGDTFVLETDHGFRIYSQQHIRVIDFSAPELTEPGGLQARQAAIDILNTDQPIVVLAYRQRMTFERWLAEIKIGSRGFADLMGQHGFVSRRTKLEEFRITRGERF